MKITNVLIITALFASASVTLAGENKALNQANTAKQAPKTFDGGKGSTLNQGGGTANKSTPPEVRGSTTTRTPEQAIKEYKNSGPAVNPQTPSRKIVEPPSPAPKKSGTVPTGK
jgi:hypothetical protein